MSIDSVNQASSLAYGATKVSKDSTANQAVWASVDDDQKAATNASPPNNAVTGTTGSNLSKEVMAQLIAVTQETADTKAYDGPLSTAERHHLEDIANDPGYAASQAKGFGTSHELVWAGWELPTVNNGYTAAEGMAFHVKEMANMASMKQVKEERTAYYENLKGQGLPPAEAYAKLLEFNANLPQSHDAALRWSESGRAMSYSDYNNARLEYLQNLISEA